MRRASQGTCRSSSTTLAGARADATISGVLPSSSLGLLTSSCFRMPVHKVSLGITITMVESSVLDGVDRMVDFNTHASTG